jgi:hypothetical protein
MAEKRLSARLALLLDVMNDRGKFHSHRTRHRGGRVELVWWSPQGRDPRWNSKMSGPCVYASQNLPMRDFASLILGKNCTFVCGSLLRGIKLISIAFFSRGALLRENFGYLPNYLNYSFFININIVKIY